MVVGLLGINDYGIASDEKADVLSFFWNVRLVTTGEPIPETRTYYGVLVPFAAEASYQVKSLIETGNLDLYFEVGDTEDSISNEDFLGRIAVKHRFIFLFSLLTYLAVAGIVGILVGREWSWLGVVMLALLPRYWGHSFFNPKDIPYATMFTVGTYVGARLVGYYLNAERGAVKLGLNRITAYSLLYGVLVGLVTGTRIAGCLLLVFVGVAHLVGGFGKKVGLRWILRYWGMYVVMGVAWIVTVFVLHPASWSNPFRWLLDGFISLSSYEWEGVNLFNGKFISAQDVPWYYLPMWLGITTPVMIQLLFLVGGLLLLIRYLRLTPEQQACAWLVVLQMGFLPGVAVLRNSTIYDGIRQFLFILPGVAVFATVGLVWLLGLVNQMRYKALVLVVLGILAVPTVVDMANLHPYEYVYFNRLIGGLQGANERFDTDYYGLSMREGMEWINTNAQPGFHVVTSRPYVSTESYAMKTINMQRIHEFDEVNFGFSYYSITLNRYEPVLGERFSDCQIVHQVMKSGAPLTSIRYCK